MARNTDYAMLQILSEAHSALKDYCGERGYKMGIFVSRLIMKEIERDTKRPGPNVLPSRHS